MRRLSLAAACALVALLPSLVQGELFQEGGVGITCEPDSAEAGVSGRGCDEWKDWPDQGFWAYDVWQFEPWTDLDIDLLISDEFGGPEHGEVTDAEVRIFLRALDWEFDNRFDWQDTDLAMTFKYAHRSEIPYDGVNPDHHFLVFQDCLDGVSVPASEINHMDVYLAPGSSAHYDSDYSAPEEDGQPSDPVIWHNNSVDVGDLGGNDPDSMDEELWPRRSAQQAAHEFTHMCWASNTETYTTQYTEGGDYNELLACSAEYLIVPPVDTLHYDLRYGYSLLRDMSNPYDPSYSDPPPTMNMYTRNLQRYHLWKLFGAYLGWRFRDSNIEETLLSRWSQNLTQRGSSWAMERTFCGLAKLMDDHDLYGYVGHGTPWEWPGAARVSSVFADYGIARWVDHNHYDPKYYFGPDFSPFWSQGQFAKIDAGDGAFWELAIPAEFVLDGDNVNQWTEYPDTGDDDCPDGWYDHDRGGGYAHTCVPIKVDLWGSNYLVFRADTSVFAGSMEDTLVVEFDWTGNMHQDVMLWLSVLTYATETTTDSLFLRGADLQSVDTNVYRLWDPQTVTIRVPDFKRDHAEAVVVILSVTDRLYSIDHDTTYKCLRRRAYAGGGPDVVFSYRFKVGWHDPGGGCPVVASRTSAGYVNDNNVLASTLTNDGDLLDAYLLSEKPEELGREYGLRISENDTDHTRFDRIQLLTVDHPHHINVAVFPDGSVGPYTVSASPVACRDSHGRDLLGAVAAPDGESARIEAGSWIDVTFPAPTETRGGGVGTRGNPGHKIEPPGGGAREASSPGVLDLAELCYRANPTTRIVADHGALVIEGEMATLRVTAPCDFHLDHMFLADLPSEPIVVQDCPVVRAEHSTQGECSGLISADDTSYLELSPGDVVELAFRAPYLDEAHVRDFVLITEGQYALGRAAALAAEPDLAHGHSQVTARPNPFRERTTIEFDVPVSGSDVTARIHDASGRLVRTLARESQAAGRLALVWDGTNDRGGTVASGVYFCRIQTGGREVESRVVVLK